MSEPISCNTNMCATEFKMSCSMIGVELILFVALNHPKKIGGFKGRGELGGDF
jgi:hypothetical protein